MGISVTASVAGDRVTIAVEGKFDFQRYDNFRTSFTDTRGVGVSQVVNLSGTEYLDSSALGMLLLLREHAGGQIPDIEISDIEIIQASPEVRKILDVPNFGELFNFSRVLE